MRSLTYCGHTDDGQPTITFATGGRAYTYALPHIGALDRVLYILRRVSTPKAFNLAKRLGTLQCQP